MELKDLPSLSETVREHGLYANKSLGQHFLLDMNLTDKIARLADPIDKAHVTEIGPGPGGLSRALLLRGVKQLSVVEMDERFIPALVEIGDCSDGRLSIVKGDALRFDIATETSAPRKIVANLPYNVGTKMLINWVSATPLFWTQMVLMFQLEVAQRVVANPGDNHYGRLAVLCQSVASCRLAFDVPARCFTPPPKVDSAVIVLEPLAKPYSDLKALGRVTQAAFGQRRKMLRRSLRSLAKDENLVLEAWLEQASIDPQARPETLSISAFQALADKISA